MAIRTIPMNMHVRINLSRFSFGNRVIVVFQEIGIPMRKSQNFFHYHLPAAPTADWSIGLRWSWSKLVGNKALLTMTAIKLLIWSPGLAL